MAANKLDTKTVGNWLWEAACTIRGPVEAPKYRDYILPLIFMKRLSDVFEDEILKLSDGYGGRETTERLIEGDHSLVRFYLSREARWDNVSKQTTRVGEYLTDCVRSIARENPQASRRY